MYKRQPTYTTATRIAEYTLNATLQSGYYVFVATYQKTGVNFIRITFQSDPYTCPYNTDCPDVYQNFQPCIGGTAGGITTTIPDAPGFPCLTPEAGTGKCTKCAPNFDLVDGQCRFPDSCPDRQYFHFGDCFPVDEACGNYDNFTGACLTCLLYTSPSPRDLSTSRMPSSA